MVGIDLIGPLPQTPRGNRYILVMVNYFTKWATARPIVQADAKSVAQELCHLLKIDRSRTTSYNPESNRQVESTSRTLKSLLRLQLERFEQNQWNVAPLTCLLAFRAAVHASTNQTPAFLTYGREIRLAADVINEPPHAPRAPGRPCFISQTREALYNAHEVARHRLSLAHKQQKTSMTGQPTASPVRWGSGDVPNHAFPYIKH
ncbi:unnamed protein product [Hymenolepis diminuta]|uniref:Integrase catalytic domain-containing protein n=1 Tax=Hymenolepis diminuta TaxID=6216 RepID=A0A0R3SYM9_HYMDI|nr:unnamed protein product [Hymenolepis diminuta]